MGKKKIVPRRTKRQFVFNVFTSDTVHLPIVRGFLTGSPPIPINIMLDMGSSVNFIVKDRVSRHQLSFKLQNNIFMQLIEKDITVAIK